MRTREEGEEQEGRGKGGREKDNMRGEKGEKLEYRGRGEEQNERKEERETRVRREIER